MITPVHVCQPDPCPTLHPNQQIIAGHGNHCLTALKTTPETILFKCSKTSSRNKTDLEAFSPPYSTTEVKGTTPPGAITNFKMGFRQWSTMWEKKVPGWLIKELIKQKNVLKNILENMYEIIYFFRRLFVWMNVCVSVCQSVHILHPLSL